MGWGPHTQESCGHASSYVLWGGNGGADAFPWVGDVGGALTPAGVPTACTSPGVDEQLFRSVEGQAASDDEDAVAERWRETPRPPASLGGLLTGLSSFRSR